MFLILSSIKPHMGNCKNEKAKAGIVIVLFVINVDNMLMGKRSLVNK
jgi:hypothetical protein